MIIFVMGLPGSGKSYFASRLADTIRADYFNSDRIRKELFANRSYSVQEKEMVYDEMMRRMKLSATQNRNVVLDATFHKKSIRDKMIREILPTEKTAFIEVKAAESLIRKRLAHIREFSEADFNVYQVIRKEWEPVLESHLVLSSTDDNLDDMLQKAIQYLHFIKNEQGTNQSIDKGGGNS